MIMKFIRPPFAFVVFCNLVGFMALANAQENGKKQRPDPITVPGVFTSSKQTEIQCDNEQLTSLELLRIIPHGTVVTKGQPLVWFQTDEWDKKVHEAEMALDLARLSLQGERFAFEQFMKTQELDRDAANRKREHAQRDHEYFLKTEYPRQLAQSEQSLKSSAFSLESTTEEYEQLSQMYKEDDLTEQSEEIVLRRARFAMESARFRHEGTQASIARSLEETMPRQKVSKVIALKRAMMDHEKVMHELNLAREKREIEMSKATEKFEEQERKFDELVAERTGVALEAPHNGIFVYGKLTRGKLGAKPVDYSEGTKVTAGQVIGTLVGTAKPSVHVQLPEKHVGDVRAGKQCTISSTTHSKLKLKGRVKSVSKLAFAAGKHDCVITLRSGVEMGILPTTTCEVSFDAPKKKGSKKGRKKAAQAEEKAAPAKSDETKKEDQ